MRRRFKLKAFITLVAVFALGIVLPLILHASTDDNARSVKVAYTQQEFIETLAPTAQRCLKTMVYLRLFSLVKLHMSRIMVAVFYLLNTITSTVWQLSRVKNVFV